MKILGIETSCDETAVAVVENNNENIIILSNVVATSLSLHAKTGGIIPEFAAREQVKSIIPVIEKALYDAKATKYEIEAIAVTVGPGLIGSLLVGVETAKTLAFSWNKPIIPVNHLFGHIYANWINPTTDHSTAVARRPSTIVFPVLALIVSGGHTDLVLMNNHNDIVWLGGTRDDAAGEAFDKIGRLLNLSYPAGPTISKLGKTGNPKAFSFPRPLIGSDNFDFSFSGLKTSAINKVKSIKKLDDRIVADLCASIEQAIVDVIVKKTSKAAQKYNVRSILLGGGVAANEKLRSELIQNAKYKLPNTAIFFPEKSLCTDNAAMIAAAAFFVGKETPLQNITANPELYFD